MKQRLASRSAPFGQRVQSTEADLLQALKKLTIRNQQLESIVGLDVEFELEEAERKAVRCENKYETVCQELEKLKDEYHEMLDRRYHFNGRDLRVALRFTEDDLKRAKNANKLLSNKLSECEAALIACQRCLQERC